MKTDDQKIIDSLKAINEDLEEENKLLKEENEKLKAAKNEFKMLLIECRSELFDLGRENDQMKDMSQLAIFASFFISTVFGFFITRFQCPDIVMNAKVAVVIGVWFSSCVTYYGVWRLVNCFGDRANEFFKNKRNRICEIIRSLRKH